VLYASDGWYAVKLPPSDHIEDSDTHPRPLTNLRLNNTGIGDPGFEAIIKWLEALHRRGRGLRSDTSEDDLSLKNIDLKAVSNQGMFLFLQSNSMFSQNNIRGTKQLAKSFMSALSKTSMTRLNISTNRLSSSFRDTLISLLPSLPHLRYLFLTMTGLTPANGRALAAYIGGAHCKLVQLNANANQMKRRGVKAIIAATRSCWTLETLELYANDFTSGDEPDESSTSDDDDIDIDPFPVVDLRHFAVDNVVDSGSRCGIKEFESTLRYTLTRNIVMKGQVKAQALDLLRYSRVMLQHASTSSSELSQAKSPVRTDSLPSETEATTFRSLPNEVQLRVLSHLAPSLSSPQRIRVFEYAVNRDTLPALVLQLSRRKLSSLKPQQPDHSLSNAGKKVGQLRPSRSYTGSSSPTASMNDIIGHRIQIERRKYWERVGCDAYDPIQ